MSRTVRTTIASRTRRLLTRALVIAGATVAGTSAAWLLGDSSSADVTGTPAVESSISEGRWVGPEPSDSPVVPLRPLQRTGEEPVRKVSPSPAPNTGFLRNSAAGPGRTGVAAPVSSAAPVPVQAGPGTALTGHQLPDCPRAGSTPPAAPSGTTGAAAPASQLGGAADAAPCASGHGAAATCKQVTEPLPEQVIGGRQLPAAPPAGERAHRCPLLGIPAPQPGTTPD